MSHTLGRRAVSLYFVVCFMVLLIVFRLLSLVSGDYSTVAKVSSQRTIEVAESRGCIYDRNYLPLVNTEYSHYAALLPDASLFTQVSAFCSTQHAQQVKKAFEKGQLSIIKTDHCFEGDSSYSFRTVKRYGADYVCAHLVGYTDSTGANGVCGIEKAFDSFLDSFSGTLSLGYTQSGYKTVLPGCGITVKNDNYLSTGGIVLTIDKALQTYIENTAQELGVITGACVVLDVKDNAVLACASFPDFSPDNLQVSLEDENEPFLNRAISAYPVGSVFKPFVAACAIEEEVDTDSLYNCTGSLTVGETQFGCYALTAHGEINISQAMENSCNCYFINLGLQVGTSRLLKMGTRFGFGEQISLAEGIESAAGAFPQEREIDSLPALANLCFGQGALTATPLQIAAAYAAFANGGYYREPYVLSQQIADNGKIIAYYRPEDGERIISESTAAAVSEYLYNNIEHGLGVNAKPENGTAAGKTATAQTGRYSEGEEILDTWFAGFFPYEKPEYVIVVFKEKGSTASKDCAPMFKAIADYMSVSF